MNRAAFLNAIATKALKRCSIILIFQALAAASFAQVALEVNVANRPADMRRVIDFFPGYENTTDFKNLKPRYVVPYGGTASSVDGIKSVGCTPVLSLLNCNSESAAKSRVAAGRQKGAKHYVIWTEPNRTWGGGDNNWLSTATWESFLEHSVKLHNGARSADPSCLLSGPNITTDPRDTKWFDHLRSFLDFWASKNCKVDYLNAHPPYEPNDVYTLSGLAKGYSNLKPALGLKGISIGEYPFFLDELAVHVRFFLAFEECWNMEFAAKSNYKANDHNSGLLSKSGAKLPSYWLFYHYARMTGRRVTTTRGGAQNKIQALGAYDEAGKTLRLLVANDETSDQGIQLTLKNVTGSATVTVNKFTSSGTQQTSSNNVSAVSGTMTVNVGTVGKDDARQVIVVFASAQNAISAQQYMAPVPAAASVLPHTRLTIARQDYGNKLPFGYNLSGRALAGNRFMACGAAVSGFVTAVQE